MFNQKNETESQSEGRFILVEKTKGIRRISYIAPFMIYPYFDTFISAIAIADKPIHTASPTTNSKQRPEASISLAHWEPQTAYLPVSIT